MIPNYYVLQVASFFVQQSIQYTFQGRNQYVVLVQTSSSDFQFITKPVETLHQILRSCPRSRSNEVTFIDKAIRNITISS